IPANPIERREEHSVNPLLIRRILCFPLLAADALEAAVFPRHSSLVVLRSRRRGHIQLAGIRLTRPYPVRRDLSAGFDVSFTMSGTTSSLGSMPLLSAATAASSDPTDSCSAGGFLRRPVSAEATAPTTQAAIANPKATPSPLWNGPVIRCGKNSRPITYAACVGDRCASSGPSSCCIGL